MATRAEGERGEKALRRPDLYVVARFLGVLWTPDSEYTRAQLQRAVRLNYDLFRNYLALLQNRGLVVLQVNGKGEEVVRITPEGLRTYRVLLEWLSKLLGADVQL